MMNYEELQEIIEKKNTKSELNISNMIFKIDQMKIYQTDNPVTEPTTRGGVYFADKNELKVEVTIFDPSITEHLSKAMLGPNKTFLDIFIKIKNNDDETLLLTNLTNSMQNSSKTVLYLTLKNIIKN